VTNHPARPCTGAPSELVRRDLGGWISGPGLDHAPGSEPVAAGNVQPGDILLINDTEAEVTDVRFGDYLLATGDHGPGVAIGWRSGSSSGVTFRAAADMLQRAAR
jgi:hypothetical protein